MAWANPNGSWNNYDMDSDGKKLKVTGETPDANTFQAEFEDTNDRETALNGDTRLNGPILALSAIQASVQVGTDSHHHHSLSMVTANLKVMSTWSRMPW